MAGDTQSPDPEKLEMLSLTLADRLLARLREGMRKRNKLDCLTAWQPLPTPTDPLAGKEFRAE